MFDIIHESSVPQDAAPRTLTRRRFLLTLAGMVAASAAAVGYVRYVEPGWVCVEEIALAVPNLPARLAGTRLAQLSDLHLGAYFTPERLLQAVEHVNRLDVSLLMLTGDFASVRARNRAARTEQYVAATASLVEPLRAAQVPMYACFGNHDLWSGLEPVARALAAAQVTLLRNAAQEVAPGLWLAGVDDVWSGNPDLRAALAGVPDGGVNLLMAHEPDYFDTVLELDAPVAVQFSGHTHGGQIRLPTLRPGPDGLYSYAPVVPHLGDHYPIGLRKVGTRHVYTNRGIGAWPYPLRLNCPPEITVFTLQAA
jgi:hypothetical protein